MKTNCTVIFIGVGIFPFRVAGDKNFLLDLKDYLIKHGIGTHFISITEKHKKIAPSDSITYIPRVFHYDLEKYYQVDTFENPIVFHHNHGVVRQFLELAVTLLVYRRKINKILSAYPNSIVHWTDMSLLMPFVKLVSFPTKTAYSTLRFEQRRPIVNRLVGMCASAADATITSTEASCQILSQNGIDLSKIHISPWGVAPKFFDSEKKQISERVRPIWSGFIQQIAEADFKQTVNVAKRVLACRDDIDFHFCLNPESFREEF